jgi:hypothetical protein
MAQGILKSIFGGGIPQNAQGRRPASMSDRDAGARDTVYRKPAAKAAPAKSSGGGGGGHKKHGGGGGGPLTTSAIPTARPNTTLGGTPTAGYEPIGNDPRGTPDPLRPPMVPMMPPLTGVPPDLLNPGPNLTLGGTPTQGYGSPSTFPGRPDIPQTPPTGPGGTPLDAGNMRGRPDPMMPPMMSPTNPTSPSRDELAAIMRQPGILSSLNGGANGLPFGKALDAAGQKYLPSLFGGAYR